MDIQLQKAQILKPHKAPYITLFNIFYTQFLIQKTSLFESKTRVQNLETEESNTTL